MHVLDRLVQMQTPAVEGLFLQLDQKLLEFDEPPAWPRQTRSQWCKMTTCPSNLPGAQAYQGLADQQAVRSTSTGLNHWFVRTLPSTEPSTARRQQERGPDDGLPDPLSEFLAQPFALAGNSIA